ncbi:hypothetical protein [Nonomuraea sp. NPDC049684]|uniref:hypothetical protein n=1 Tax=Nonomuraea sp. NPDC049684 TaxID=3364356 RepID=UPI0037AFC36A
MGMVGKRLAVKQAGERQVIKRVLTVLRCLGGLAALAAVPALPWLLALLGVYGPDGWQRWVLGGAAVPVGWALLWAAMVGLAPIVDALGKIWIWSWLADTLVAVMACWLVCAVGVSFIVAPALISDKALAERGRVSVCLVTGVRAYTVMDSIPGHGDPGAFSYRYDYRLRCPGGTPDAMQTRSPAAKPGTVLQIRWDPAGRVPPSPAGESADLHNSLRRMAWVIGGATVLLTALGVTHLIRSYVKTRAAAQARRRMYLAVGEGRSRRHRWRRGD